MNPICRSLDARGLPCPQPVILARKALAEGGFHTLEITVNDPAARENLLKFAAYAKCQAETGPTEAGVTVIRLSPQGVPAAAAERDPSLRSAALETDPGLPSAPGFAPAATVLLTADGVGQGDPALARLLMRGFVYTLTEAEHLPQRLILMNSAVKLAVAGSDCLVNLHKLEARGVELLACGTCLEFYGLLAALSAGRITNMYEISCHLLDGPTVTMG